MSDASNNKLALSLSRHCSFCNNKGVLCKEWLEPCNWCNGSGTKYVAGKAHTCSACSGKGQEVHYTYVPCPQPNCPFR